MNRTKMARDGGFAAVWVLVLLMGVGLVVGGLLKIAPSEQRVALSDQDGVQALDYAESAIEYAMAYLADGGFSENRPLIDELEVSDTGGYKGLTIALDPATSHYRIAATGYQTRDSRTVERRVEAVVGFVDGPGGDPSGESLFFTHKIEFELDDEYVPVPIRWNTDPLGKTRWGSWDGWGAWVDDVVRWESRNAYEPPTAHLDCLNSTNPNSDDITLDTDPSGTCRWGSGDGNLGPGPWNWAPVFNGVTVVIPGKFESTQWGALPSLVDMTTYVGGRFYLGGGSALTLDNVSVFAADDATLHAGGAQWDIGGRVISMTSLGNLTLSGNAAFTFDSEVSLAAKGHMTTGNNTFRFLGPTRIDVGNAYGSTSGLVIRGGHFDSRASLRVAHGNVRFQEKRTTFAGPAQLDLNGNLEVANNGAIEFGPSAPATLNVAGAITLRNGASKFLGGTTVRVKNDLTVGGSASAEFVGPATFHVDGSVDLGGSGSTKFHGPATFYVSGDMSVGGNGKFEFKDETTLYVGGNLRLSAGGGTRFEGVTNVWVNGDLSIDGGSNLGFFDETNFYVNGGVRITGGGWTSGDSLSAGLEAPWIVFHIRKGLTMSGAAGAGSSIYMPDAAFLFSDDQEYASYPIQLSGSSYIYGGIYAPTRLVDLPGGNLGSRFYGSIKGRRLTRGERGLTAEEIAILQKNFDDVKERMLRFDRYSHEGNEGGGDETSPLRRLRWTENP